MKMEKVSATQPVAVLFMNGIYKVYEGKVYRHTFDDYPLKKHRHTGYKTLQEILDTHARAEAIYPGEQVTITF